MATLAPPGPGPSGFRIPESPPFMMVPFLGTASSSPWATGFAWLGTNGERSIHKGRSEMVAVRHPYKGISPASDSERWCEKNWRCASAAGALVRADDQAAICVLGALAKGHPDRYAGFQTWETDAFEIGSGGMISVGLDGELMEIEPPVRFSVRLGVLCASPKERSACRPRRVAQARASCCLTCGASRSVVETLPRHQLEDWRAPR